ncbi:hypothetical protein I8T81_12605 [Acinetobacter seifertii]|uniref:three component ABC system middle component n=1 Tax=Acinetobacter seifertii TaxID=1530123 RepID=UPI0018DDCB9B|nr:three component ABC system middle component [Acinetobacter seifertii]QPV58135.1 hypothetical protein I8T81_12605 [Acinetobacter seifertii]
MNRLFHNELMGVVAIQSALENSNENRLSLAKVMLILPLLFDKNIRSILKRKNSVVLSSKDLLLSNPEAFINVRARYEDLVITSLNSMILTQELGIATLMGEYLTLEKKIFFQNKNEIGKIATDILAAGPKLGLLLNETNINLYQTFRIDL